MKRLGWLCVAVIAAAGCTDDDSPPGSPPTTWPEAQIDVDVSATAVWVSAVEVASGQCAYLPFLRSGCDVIADLRGCERLVDYIASVTLEQDGGPDVDLALSTWNTPRWGGERTAGATATAVVMTTADGQHIRVAIPAATAPVPAIVSMTAADDTLHVEWRATPDAGSAVVQLGDPNTAMYVGRCHVTEPTVDFAWSADGVGQGRTVFVISYAAPSTTTTAIGDAKVGIGAATSAATPQP